MLLNYTHASKEHRLIGRQDKLNFNTAGMDTEFVPVMRA